MMAGFAWKWETKNNKDAFDIVIEGIPKRWNSPRRIGLTPPTPSTKSDAFIRYKATTSTTDS